ncbi:metal-binding protein [Streptomyces agglomeratus]|uniref:Metal-binding protein n=1 Tax=Streptomyces agglomeratus TaxID=285458 RepID=A0A1E5PBG1_9ACTN|nr:CYTH and CHAD domain-containing protein [Streptomyces agglomeratus]OEJ26901.1 metal-binding protein [Streptomyces agglomeratus]OEJ39051.1 metal-binding protein [Streptomyces agglomeratus]OEJ46567.1 metal-binding protein [Streptomyces agglomeratus]OEJ51575.1 metal-binding protein [Streptomyces agglomeratus]OEJ58977.1 metal-binding protein [Streptomyces agglomeratus]
MADTKREIERKYEAEAEATGETRLPDLTKVAGVSSVREDGVVELDAVYYDTEDLRLAAHSVTLRRRTGGDDAGWHLKLPVSPDTRDEIRAPLTDGLPSALAALIRSRTLGEPVAPVVRLRSVRDVRQLLDARGEPLAEVSVDTVTAQRLGVPADRATTRWTEIEVELADEGDPALLDAVGKKLRKAGLRPARSASKLARALADTEPQPEKSPGQPPRPRTAGDHVLAYLREQYEALVAYDPAVRRGLPDSVHQMRVATRRLRSALRTYRKVLDRAATDLVVAELKWLAGELGADRDQEVLDARLHARLEDVPGTLLRGPVRGRLRIWSVGTRDAARARTTEALDSPRHLDLLVALNALLADPPLRPAASKPAAEVLPRAVLKDFGRLAVRMERALALPPGDERDRALHNARKAAKRTRYAADAARPALGGPAKRFAKHVKAVQSVLGEHQDSVVARTTLRDLAARADAAGETAFTWGLLYGREEAASQARERELPEVWKRATAGKLRTDLGG